MVRRTLVALLIACPLVFSPFTLESFEQPKLAVLLLGALLLAAAWAARGFGGRWGWVEAAWALGLASAALSTALSTSPLVSFFGANESWAGLVTVAATALVFAAARSLETEGRWRWAPVAAAAVTSLYSLSQRYGLDAMAWSRTASFAGQTRPFGTLGHPNLAAAFFAMAAPVALWLAVRTQRRFALVALGAALSLVVAATVLALSRAGWLALAVSLATALAGWLAAGERAAVKRAVLVLATAAVGSAALLSPLWFPKPERAGQTPSASPVTERVRDLTNASTRKFIWTAAWQVFREHPLTGSGLDTFQLSFPRHRTAGYWELEWGATPQRAHNELLQALATQGALGALSYLAMPAALLFALARAWKQRALRLPGVALFASAAGFWVQGVFGFTTVATGTFFAVVAGQLAALGVPRDGEVQPVRPAWLRQSAALLAVAAAWALVVRPLWASVEMRVGDERLGRERYSALQLHADATVVLPESDVAWTKLGATAQAVARAAPAGEKIRLLGVALYAYRRALALVPADVYHRANLARALGEQAALGLSPSAEAFAAWDEVLSRDPANAVLFVDAGNTALLLGDKERTRAWATQALALYPRYAPPRAQLAFLALQAGDFSQARRGLEEALAGEWRDDTRAQAVALTNLASACLAQQDVAAARVAATRAVQLAPELEGAKALLEQVNAASN